MISTQWIVGILLLGIVIGEVEARYVGFLSGLARKVLKSVGLKTLFLAAVALLLAGCGGLYQLSHTLTTTRTVSFAPSAVAVYYEYSDINVDQNLYENPAILSVLQRIDVNVGGDGSVGFAFAAIGTDCSLVTPTEVIPITAGITTLDTPISPALLADLNSNLLAAGSATRFCVMVTNADIGNPIDVEFTITATVSTTTSI